MSNSIPQPVILVVLLCSTAVPLGAAERTRPDIVVFLSDDHTVTDSSLYGSPDLTTDNMDRIAATGMTFDAAYVASPSCAPSRAALLTGLYPPNNGAEPNHARPRKDIKKLPAFLQELGYEVVAFGKVGHYVQTTEYGFDIARHYTYHDDRAVPEAIQWLTRRESNKPLCLFIGTNWPHVPWPKDTRFDPSALVVPPHHADTPETRQHRAKYYEAVQIMDRELGAVYDAVREKLGDDALFIHTSDHGAQWPFAKWNLYEEGVRTPMIVSWPGRVEAATRTNAMVSWIDILPTLVEVAGGQPDPTWDGRSLLPVLDGRTPAHRDTIVTTHSGDGSNNVYPCRAIRDRRWKLIRNLYPEFRFTSHVTRSQDGRYYASWREAASTDPRAAQAVEKYESRPAEELYDLTADPQEQHNLAADPAHAAELDRLRGQLAQWQQNTSDQPHIFGIPKLLPRPGPKPNIVTVLIDDMGYSDLSCFGGKGVETPQIDKLAAEGLRFTQFYVNSPICSSSRTALTTGHYPQRHRISSFLARRKLNQQRGMAHWLDHEAVTLPRLTQQAGYATGHFGKWHMGGQRDVGNAPHIAEYGFDCSLTNFEGLGPRILPLKDAYDGTPPKPHALGSDLLGQGPIEWLDRSQITGRFVTEAIDFIDKAQRQEKPFYINVWPDDVHSPFFPPQGRRGDGAKRTLYHAVLRAMDEQLRPLFQRIAEDPQLRQNTLILIASDNGPEPGAGTSTPLRGTKGDLWEGGTRSPLIVWGPGLLDEQAAGKQNTTTIASSIDLVASLVTLCNLSPPDDYQCDGEDLLGALLGLSLDGQRLTPLFWRRPPAVEPLKKGYHPDLAVRDGPWKLLCKIDGTKVRLYNLEDDPAESHNQKTQRPKIAARLKRALLAWNATLPPDAVGQGL